MKKYLFSILFTFLCTLLHAQFIEGSFMINGNSLPYQILYPKNYDETKQYPLLIFLHGAGERGQDNAAQLKNGKQFILDNFYTKYPAIVLIPQCPSNSYWSNVQRNQIGNKATFRYGLTNDPTTAMQALTYLIADWTNFKNVNQNQIYVGGLSMGGMGVYELLWRMPNTFASAFVICGGGNMKKIADAASYTPIWIFHGSADPIVPVQFARDLYKDIYKANKESKYTEYPGVGHNSWNNAFQEKDLVPWLFSKKRY